MNLEKLFEGDVLENFSGLFYDLARELKNVSVALNIGVILVALVLAFFSYKIYKVCIALGGAVGGWFFGAGVIGAVMEKVIDKDISVICGIVCAILFAAIAFALYKVGIFLSGAAIGYLVFLPVTALIVEKINPSGAGISQETISFLINGVFAIIVGILFVKLFKPLYIFTTSFGYSLFATLTAATSWFGAHTTAVIIALILGLGIGVCAMVVQLKTNKPKSKQPPKGNGGDDDHHFAPSEKKATGEASRL